MGAFACLPFAIWFYLAIEGVANVAEESKDPAKDIPRGFLGAIATLVVLALLVFFAATGVGGWEKIVFDAAGNASDSPLPMALELVVGREHIFYQLLITVGIFGLIASFHGIILIAGRATFEMGRVGNLPAALGKLLPGRKTPAMALVLNMLVGFVAIALGRTGEMITLSVFGALGLYIMGSAAVLKLRESEPELERPYRAPGMPWLPRIALVIALGCLVSMVVYNTKIAVIFGGLMLGGWGYYRWSEGGSEGV